MRTKPLIAVALLAVGCPSFAVAQSRLPGDWEQKVSAVVKEPERARRVAEAGRQYEAKRQAYLDVMKAAEGDVKAAFFSQTSSVGERQLSVSLLRDDRRKASLSAVDALLAVRPLVSIKEWKELWPEGYFTPAAAPPVFTGRVRQALPSVVTDPARLKKADGVMATFTTAAKGEESARRKATGKFQKLLESYDSVRDDFIDIVNDLEETQMKSDNAVVGAASELQKILTPEEWTALVGSLAPAP